MRTSLTVCAALVTAVLAASPGSAAAAAVESSPVALSLREAIELGLGRDPGIVSAKQTRDRSQLGVTRAQLDRFSLRVDAFLNEQYRAGNIGGSAPSPSCSTLAPARALTGSGTLYAPLSLLSLGAGGIGVPSEGECAAAGGQFYQGETLQSGALGQFSVAANLSVPIFSGFRVTATVERAQHLRDSAEASVKQSERQTALDVLRSYWAARRLEMQLDVSQQSLARYDEAAAAVAARVKNGLAPVIDQNRMESRRQSEVARRADLEGGLLEAKAQLSVLLGIPAAQHQPDRSRRAASATVGQHGERRSAAQRSAGAATGAASGPLPRCWRRFRRCGLRARPITRSCRCRVFCSSRTTRITR
jgi:hypothetical protein